MYFLAVCNLRKICQVPSTPRAKRIANREGDPARSNRLPMSGTVRTQKHVCTYARMRLDYNSITTTSYYNIDLYYNNAL